MKSNRLTRLYKSRDLQVQRTVFGKSTKVSWIIDFAKLRPGVFVVLVFFAVALFFTTVLMLPFSSSTGQFTPFTTAFFTTTSAISGTGFQIVPTSTYWSLFGQFIIMFVIQIGGLGIMTVASAVALVVSKRLGLTSKILTVSDVKSSKYGELGSLIRMIVAIVFIIEAITTAFLVPKLIELHEGFASAIWHAVFFSVSSFNSAGFSISGIPFTQLSYHWGIVIPMFVALFIGSVGFPVMSNVIQAVKFRSLRIINLHTKVVLIMIVSLYVILVAWFEIAEWNNVKLFTDPVLNDPIAHAANLAMAAFVTPTAGFDTINVGSLTEPSILISEIWMFIGGAPASTCSGIKVTTLAVLLLAVWAEFRGNTDIVLFGKRLQQGALKIAVTIFICAIGIVLVFSFLLSFLTPDVPFKVIQFDVISAFSNCGLSIGLITHLNDAGAIWMGILMFLGRIGTMSIVSSVVKSLKNTFVRYPEENVILG